MLKHRILVFKLEFKLDLLQMALNFMLLQDSWMRPIQVRSKVTDSYTPIFLVFLTVRKFLSNINTGPDDFIHGPWEKLKTPDKQNNALRWTIQQHTQLYYRITSSLASITFNHRLGHCASGSQILSWGSIKYPWFTLYYSLITGLLVLWGQNYGIQYLVKNAWILENLPTFRDAPPTLPLCMNLPSS